MEPPGRNLASTLTALMIKKPNTSDRLLSRRVAIDKPTTSGGPPVRVTVEHAGDFATEMYTRSTTTSLLGAWGVDMLAFYGSDGTPVSGSQAVDREMQRQPLCSASHTDMLPGLSKPCRFRSYRLLRTRRSIQCSVYGSDHAAVSSSQIVHRWMCHQPLGSASYKEFSS